MKAGSWWFLGGLPRRFGVGAMGGARTALDRMCSGRSSAWWRSR